jgi:hypothetical protein
MSLCNLKRKLKDWEDRFFLKYKRSASIEDIKKFPKVYDVYQQIKQLSQKKLDTIEEREENNVEIKPSPFKPSQRGLFKSLSMTNVRGASSFLKRLSESDIDHPKKIKLDTKQQIPQFFTNSASEKDSFAFGTELNKSKQEEIQSFVEIDEDPVEENQKYIVRKMLAESTKQLPKAKKWFQTKPEHKIQTKETVEQSPIERTDFSLHMSPEKDPDEIAIIPRPNQNINANSLRRSQSFTFGDLPLNYQDFLSKEEIENFSDLINEIKKDENKEFKIPHQKDQGNVSETIRCKNSDLLEGKQTSPSLDESNLDTLQENQTCKISNTRRTAHKNRNQSMFSDEVQSEIDEVLDETFVSEAFEKSQMKVEVKKRSKLNIKNVNVKKESCGNENFCALKLKPKKGGPTKLSFGKNRKFANLKYQD